MKTEGHVGIDSAGKATIALAFIEGRQMPYQEAEAILIGENRLSGLFVESERIGARA